MEGYRPDVGEAVTRVHYSEGSQAVKPRPVSPPTDISRKSRKDIFCDYEICMKWQQAKYDSILPPIVSESIQISCGKLSQGNLRSCAPHAGSYPHCGEAGKDGSNCRFLSTEVHSLTYSFQVLCVLFSICDARWMHCERGQSMCFQEG